MTDNAKQFDLVIRDWLEAAEEDLKIAFQEITFEVFTRVVLRSPVDTGRFRGSWVVDLNSRSDAIPDSIVAGGVAISAGRQAIDGANIGDTINIFNNQPYSVALEFGHSIRQAPQGMVRVTLSEIDQIVSEVT